MKKIVTLLVLLVSLQPILVAQSVDDDLYLVPKKKVKTTIYQPKTSYVRPIRTDTIYKNDTTVVRQSVVYQEPEGGEWINGFEGSAFDYEYASRIIRYQNPRYAVHISDPYYWDVINGLNSWDWNVYVDHTYNYAYAFPTSTSRFWYDWRFNSRPYGSRYGWNVWGYNTYGSYGMSNYYYDYPYAWNMHHYRPISHSYTSNHTYYNNRRNTYPGTSTLANRRASLTKDKVNTTRVSSSRVGYERPSARSTYSRPSSTRGRVVKATTTSNVPRATLIDRTSRSTRSTSSTRVTRSTRATKATNLNTINTARFTRPSVSTSRSSRYTRPSSNSSRSRTYSPSSSSTRQSARTYSRPSISRSRPVSRSVTKSSSNYRSTPSTRSVSSRSSSVRSSSSRSYRSSGSSSRSSGGSSRSSGSSSRSSSSGSRVHK